MTVPGAGTQALPGGAVRPGWLARMIAIVDRSRSNAWRERSPEDDDAVADALGFDAGADPAFASVSGQLGDWTHAKRGLRLRTLVYLRWWAVGGQAATVLWVHFGLGFHLHLLSCLAVIAAAAWMNLSVSLAWPLARLAGAREAVFQLAFDLLELTILLALTGGIANPFSLLLVAPVVVGAATLPTRHAAGLGLLALGAASVLAVWFAPLPWRTGTAFSLPPLYLLALWMATVVGVVFTGAYAWQAQAEAQRMELALVATQAVLAREQRLSALGGLAAAAAHELGTPLATIQVVAKEMGRAVERGSPLAEDVDLLVSQAERCRDILRKLARSPDAADQRHARMSLSQLLDEVAEPHRSEGVLINESVECSPGAPILEVRRLAEVLHGLQAFVENAVDFADATIDVAAWYDAKFLTITVTDDGVGFTPEVMAQLGEPYFTTRSQGEGSRTGHYGMGLGFFIAKTLLERSGARVSARNARQGGAVISARWPRARIEAVDLV